METDKADKRLWLVKVPPYVAKRWREACSQAPTEIDVDGPDTVLGTIAIAPQADGSNSINLQLPGEGGAAPSSYNLIPAPAQHHMLAFSLDSVNEEGAAVNARVEGTIGQRFDVVPTAARSLGGGSSSGLDAQYRALNRKRTLEARQKGRGMQLIEDRREANKLGASNLGPLWSKNKQQVRQAVESRETKRRVRLDKDELEGLLFGLFGRQQHWHFTQLQKETDQPSAWLKEVLVGIALQVKRGPNKDLWELQQQYRVPGGGGGGGGGQEGVAGGQ